MPATHEVTNQPPPLVGRDLVTHAALLDGLHREGGGWAEAQVRELGRFAGSERVQQWGRLANEHAPVLRTHDRYGHRLDEVEYSPAYHELMREAVAAGLHASAWCDGRAGAHVARAAKLMVWTAADAGHLCPISMTYAAVPALRVEPELAARYEPLLATSCYAPGLAPPLAKPGLLAGMSMTEKQGGSDVRTNTTRAVATGDGMHRLTGHKWFTSAPMSDLFLTLGQTAEGLSCFLVPRVLPDGARNAFHLQRLKDKLGNRSNASAEVEYDGALGYPVGPLGAGIRTIIEMVAVTRLDCVLLAAAGMRIGVAQALHHGTHRTAFGSRLRDLPAMTNVLADLAVESDAATTLALRLAGAFDRAIRGDAAEAAFERIALAASKYWLCKRWSGHAAEALECLGGNGYIEDSGMPRLYREAPLVSIWEGAGNVAALDLVRAIRTQPDSVDALLAELRRAAGADSRFDAALAALEQTITDREQLDYRARYVAETTTLVLQAALLLRDGSSAVAEAFLASRLGGQSGRAYGTLPRGLDTGAILARADLIVDP